MHKQRSIVFVAWGAFAYDKLKDIDQTKHHLLVSSHPSPFSARRTFKHFPAFLNSRPFSQINSKLDVVNSLVIIFIVSTIYIFKTDIHSIPQFQCFTNSLLDLFFIFIARKLCTATHDFSQ